MKIPTVRKILGITLISLFSFQNGLASASETFTDVNLGNENYVAITYLKDQGILEGYPDGTFQPLAEIKRGEALKITLSAFKQTKPSSETTKKEDMNFSDVSPDDWFAPYIEEGIKNGIIQGYPENKFYPGKTINRVESLKMTLLQFGEKIPEDVTTPPYSDIPLNVWFTPYAEVSRIKNLFFLDRKTGGLNPDQKVNRGSFAALIYRIIKSSQGTQFGRATWYGVGKGTASGEPFNPNLLTAAHKTLPFGTKLKVTNLANGKSVIVKVNDRGPYAKGMDIDLTSAAFEEIGSLSSGIINTQFEIVTEETTPETNGL